MRGGVVLNLGAIKRAHQMVISRTGLVVQRAAEEAGKEAVKLVHAKPTFTPRTGNLQRKTSHKVFVRARGKVLQLRNTAKYAAAIDKGARPHVIRARRRKTLRFWHPVNGWRFPVQVMHPGNKPYRFLRSAVNVAGPAWFHGIEQGMHDIAKRF